MEIKEFSTIIDKFVNQIKELTYLVAGALKNQALSHLPKNLKPLLKLPKIAIVLHQRSTSISLTYSSTCTMYSRIIKA